MKLTFWVAIQEQDSACYNLVGRTKKEVLDKITRQHYGDEYNQLAHVEIEYDNGFQLFDMLTGEGGNSYRGVIAGDKILSFYIRGDKMVWKKLSESDTVFFLQNDWC